jgi:hypothetical protein
MSSDLPSLLSSGLSLSFFSLDVLAILLWLFSRSEQLCNGHAGLCDRKYGNTTFIGAHDSFAYSGNPFARKD